MITVSGARARALVVTGFPGFLGSQLLPRLLRRRPERAAICLVQPRYAALATRRVRDLEVSDPSLVGRIELVEGDITRPDLGLGPRFGEVAARAREVVHLAAVYDLEVERALAERVNVEGTRHVLALCRAADDLERLHHVSTCYVSGRWPGVFREDDLDVGQRFNNVYEETKFRSELLVAEARDEGAPATVYRPSVVGGDARTGATQKYDGPYFVLRWLLRQPAWFAVMPVVGDPRSHRFNVVPRDLVVDGIDALAARADTVGGTYALADPQPATVEELLRAFGHATGRRVVRVPLPTSLVRWSLRHVPGLTRLTGIPAAAVDYFTHPTVYTTDRAAPLLASAGVRLPDRAAWIDAMAAFVAANPRVASTAMV